MSNKICISKNNIIYILLLIFIIIYISNKLFKNNNEQNFRQNNEQTIRQNNEQTIRQNNEQNLRQNNVQDIKQNNVQDIKQNNVQDIKQNNEQDIKQNNVQDIKQTNDQTIKQTNVQDNNNVQINELLLYEYNNNRDRKVLYDDFTAPERRDYINNKYSLQKIINLPTRGYPDNYQLIGILLRNNTENGFNLFGRQKFQGSNQYEYYAVGKLNNTDIKIPLSVKGDKELFDGDEILVQGTDSDKGLFIVKLYNYETYRYNPYSY
jgi:hypothetical protein